MRTTAIRATTAALLVSAAAFGLTGCVNAEQAAPAGAGESVSYGNPPAFLPSQADDQHNAADVTFLNQAVLLRQQAVSVSYLALAAGATTNTQLKALATQLTTDQQPQVNTLIGWLSQWGQPTPSATDGQVAGLLSASDLTALQSAKGGAFDTQWIAAMKSNFTAVIAAANTVASAGSSGEVRQAAQQWVTQLQAEQTTLNGLSG